MNPFLNSALDVRILWAISHRWNAGRKEAWPAAAHALWLVQEGTVELWSHEKCWTVRQGQIFLWPKSLPRRIVGVTDARWLSIGLVATSPSHPDLLNLLDLPGSHTPHPSQRLPVARWMENLLELDGYEFEPECLRECSGRWEKSVSTRPTHLDIVADSMARAIFGWCWGTWGTVDLNTVLNQQSPLWLLKTLDHIREQPHMSVANLAKSSNFSPAQFRRLFRQHIRQSPQQYLLRHRLEVAQRLLITTDLPIDEVAVRSGFPTPTHFMKLWKKSRGLSALQYRLARRATN